MKIVSGDTIHVFVNGDVERVRYIGVTAPDAGDGRPDSGDPQGREALQFNRGLTNAKNVRLELDVQERDPEGRLLAYVWLGDVMVNAELIGHGLGQVVTGGPNVRHQEKLLRRQEQARAAKLGIWKTAGPAPPAKGTSPAAPPGAEGRAGPARRGAEDGLELPADAIRSRRTSRPIRRSAASTTCPAAAPMRRAVPSAATPPRTRPARTAAAARGARVSPSESCSRAAEPGIVHAMAGHLILVVDEEAAARQALIDVLSLDGHEVDGAGDADGALLLLDQRRYELVIADVRMPKLDGPALLDALAERFTDALPQVVFLTHAAFDPHYGSFLTNLRAPVLTKPLKPGRVLELVTRIFAS